MITPWWALRTTGYKLFKMLNAESTKRLARHSKSVVNNRRPDCLAVIGFVLSLLYPCLTATHALPLQDLNKAMPFSVVLDRQFQSICHCQDYILHSSSLNIVSPYIRLCKPSAFTMSRNFTRSLQTTGRTLIQLIGSPLDDIVARNGANGTRQRTSAEAVCKAIDGSCELTYWSSKGILLY